MHQLEAFRLIFIKPVFGTIKLAYPQAESVLHLAAGQHAWGGHPTKTSRPRIGQLDMT